jgi:hypothetical protein
VERGLRGGCGVLDQSGRARSAELLRVNDDVGIRQQGDHVATQHERARVVAERTPCVVGSFVQPGARRLHGEPRPQRLDHALAMQSAARRQGEKLDQGSRVAPRPALGWDRDTVHGNLEPAEQSDLYRHSHGAPLDNEFTLRVSLTRRKE